MKKIACFLICATMIALQSCDPKFGIAYSVKANGEADGVVNVTFPNGQLEASGDAALAFSWSNDTTVTCLRSNELEDALMSSNKEIRQAAEGIDEWVNETFNVTSAGGTYFVHLEGYVRETATGLTVFINRTFTNRADSTVQVER